MGATTRALGDDDAPDDSRLRLFDVHERRLFRLARRLSASHDEALDLVQETFVRAFSSQKPLPVDEGEQYAWLVTTMANLARDRRRRLVVRTRVLAADVPRTVDDPEGSYVSKIAVQAALAQLDARRRAVIVLHELEGEPVARVAALLGISPVTVRWHLARARRRLGRLLGNGEP